MFHLLLYNIICLFIIRYSRVKNTQDVYLNLVKPMSLAFSLKHCLHMLIPYFLTKPEWEEQILHCLEPLPKFLGCEYQTFS